MRDTALLKEGVAAHRGDKVTWTSKDYGRREGQIQRIPKPGNGSTYLFVSMLTRGKSRFARIQSHRCELLPDDSLR